MIDFLGDYCGIIYTFLTPINSTNTHTFQNIGKPEIFRHPIHIQFWTQYEIEIKN